MNLLLYYNTVFVLQYSTCMYYIQYMYTIKYATFFIHTSYNTYLLYIGYYMSFSSCINTVINGLFLGPVLVYYKSSTNAINYSILYMCILYCIQAIFTMPYISSILFTTTPTTTTTTSTPTTSTIVDNANSSNSSINDIELYIFIITTLILSVFQYILSTTLTGESTSRVEAAEKGTLLGLEHRLVT